MGELMETSGELQSEGIQNLIKFVPFVAERVEKTA
jgi:hypothetical protein